MDKKNFELKLYSGPKGSHDLTKRWFAYYSIILANGKKSRKKIYGELNSFNSVEKRLEEFKRIAQSFVPVRVRNISKKHRLYELLNRRALNNRKKTIQTYKSKIDIFLFYFSYKSIRQFTITDSFEFFDSLLKSGHSPTTVNSYRTLLKSLFGELKDLNEIRVNPFNGTRKYAESRESAMYFSNEQSSQLMEHFKLHEHKLYIAVQFLYYCFIRPTELRGLRVKYINLTNRTIYIPGSISKNKKSQYVKIPNAFYNTLVNMNLSKRHPDEFVISPKANGKTPIAINYLTRHHLNVLRKLGYSQEYKLYSWKHSGVVACARAGVPLKDLQLQLRHHSLDMVNTYLKNLGIHDCIELANLFPDISKPTSQAPFHQASHD